MTEKQKTGEQKFDAGEAQRLIEEEQNARARVCLTEIMQVAEKYRCQVEAVSYITAEGRVLAQFRVVAV